MAGYWWGLRMAYHPATWARDNIQKAVAVIYDGMHNRGR